MNAVARSAHLRSTLLARFRVEAPQLVRIVVAACLSWQLCEWIDPSTHSHPPVYAVVVPLVAMRDQPYSAFNVAFDRLLGVACGVAVGIGVVNWLGPNVWSVGLVLLIGLVLGVALRLGPSLNIQVAASGLLVFANSDPDSYAATRLWETAFGVLVTVVLSPLLLPTNARKTYVRELSAVRTGLADLLARCAHLEAGDNPPDGLRELGSQLEQRARSLPAQFAAAGRAVARNPLRHHDRMPLDALLGATTETSQLGAAAATLVDEVTDLATRPDLHTQWPAMRRPLEAVLDPVIADLHRTVGGSPASSDPPVAGDPPAPDDLADAVDAFRSWVSGDSTPLAAVLRRPARRILVALGHNPGVPSYPDAPAVR